MRTDAGLDVGGDHLVHFYESDDALVDLVTRYLAAVLLDGDAAVVIATETHRHAISEGFVDAGIDVASAVRDGSLQLFDAREVLDGFLVGGSIDSSRFIANVGAMIRSAGQNGRAVRAFGEMVALLWASGAPSAAVELEKLWNALGDQLPFALFCGYPAELIGLHHDALVADVCRLHSTVIPTTPRPRPVEARRRFSASPDAPRLARQFVREVLGSWGVVDDVLVDNCSLVVSELAANAVRHAGSDCTVVVSAVGAGVHLAVHDHSSERAQPRAVDARSIGGRGLRIVESVAQRWGQATHDDGKVVWAQLGTLDAGAV